MSERLTVHQNDLAIYDILIERDFSRLGKAVTDAMDMRNHKICIITDSNVAPLYADTVKKQLEACCRQVDIYIFPAGEEYKTLDVVRKIYEYLILNHYDRTDCLAALGGGVTGDLVGFTAATFLRGISFIQIPTTLLAQVDSSIGGKTGVDFDSYKNMVGAFHMPSLVYICTDTLRTLDDEQFACGMGEIIKHGLIRDAAYFEWLGQNADAIQARDPQLCEQMILVSDHIKRAVVEKDPTEKGERALLNFGHTLGHAIEKQMNFQWYHGQCVALGCVAAAYLSAVRGNLSFDEVNAVRNMMTRFHLPVTLTGSHLEPEKIIAATKNDKKMESGKIKFVLLSRIGNAYIDRTISDQEMLKALEWLGGGAHEI